MEEYTIQMEQKERTNAFLLISKWKKPFDLYNLYNVL